MTEVVTLGVVVRPAWAQGRAFPITGRDPGADLRCDDDPVTPFELGILLGAMHKGETSANGGPPAAGAIAVTVLASRRSLSTSSLPRRLREAAKVDQRSSWTLKRARARWTHRLLGRVPTAKAIVAAWREAFPNGWTKRPREARAPKVEVLPAPAMPPIE